MNESGAANNTGSGDTTTTTTSRSAQDKQQTQQPQQQPRQQPTTNQPDQASPARRDQQPQQQQRQVQQAQTSSRRASDNEHQRTGSIVAIEPTGATAATAAATAATRVGAVAPRRPRPVVHRHPASHLMRRGQFVAFANPQQQQQQHHHHLHHHPAGSLITIEPQNGPAAAHAHAHAHAYAGMPITAQIELAGVLQPAGRATGMPPKRPNYLPAAARLGDHHHRYAPQQLTTSLGATALTHSSSSNKPNRYSWAQMQQWHAAQNATLEHQNERLYGGGGGAGGDLSSGKGPAANQQDGSRAGGGGGFHYHFSSPFSSAASRVLVVPNPIVNLGEHTKSRLIKIIEALKRFSEKWFSHVLLLLFLASYACLGAYIFISFEAPTEQWEKQLIIDTRARIVNESYDQAHQLGSREQFVDQFRSRFEDYERLLNRMCASGMSSSSLENQWTFWGALFYSMTVFTTIGYGHLTPITFAGRVATMIYAIFGIPILLMVLADLGKLLTRIIKYAFKKFRYWYYKLMGRKASVRTRQLISDHSNQYIGVARNAFERGFATYIQPYQSRTASALRDAQMRMAASLRHQQRHHSSGQLSSSAAGGGAGSQDHQVLLVDQNGQISYQLAQPISRRPSMIGATAADELQMESSEVIVTPAKQTKPVSPKISNKAHPLADEGGVAAGAGKEGPTANKQPTDGHHHHGQHATGSHAGRRAQSPFSGSGGSGNLPAAKRKISAGSKHNQQRRNSVSRSSSASNVATSGERQAKAAMVATVAAAAPKRFSLDNQATPSAPQTDQSTGCSATQLDANQAEQQQQADLSQISHSANQEPADEELQASGGDGGGEEADEELEYDDMDEDLDIPVSFALFLLITYMMFGAVVFSIWESWNFFDALYFVFISMSTIGFGDLVPQHPKRMIGTFAYLLFGLALTSMCINVVQEKIHATFLRAKMQIGEKMGFDLDQIMADDYYDSNSAYGDESAADHMGPLDHEDDNGSYANSLAVSQANSQNGTTPGVAVNETLLSGSQSNNADGGGGGGGSRQQDLRPSSSLDNHHPEGHLQPGASAPVHTPAGKSLRSKDSMKWKRRSNSGNSTDQHLVGQSIRRKTSSGANSGKQQKSAASSLSRQTSPPAVVMVDKTAASSPATNSPTKSGAGGAMSPIKSQMETIRMFNLPVQSQVDQEATAAAPGQRQRTAAPAPSINQPIAEAIRSFCQPLRRVFGGAGGGAAQPQVTVSNHSNSNHNSSPSEQQILTSASQDSPPHNQAPPPASTRPGGVNQALRPNQAVVAILPAPLQQRMPTSKSLDLSAFNHQPSHSTSNGSQTQRHRQPSPHYKPATAASIRAASTTLRQPINGTTTTGLRQHHSSERSRQPGARPLSRSLNSSRRASVSHELSQLDDLIVALCGSPPERFGPLLGIPSAASSSSTRTGRSVSPNVATLAARQRRPQSAASMLAPSDNQSAAPQRRGNSMLAAAAGRQGSNSLEPTASGGLGGAQPPTSPSLHKKRSLRLSQSPSHQLLLLANHDGSEQPGVAAAQQRRKSSASSAATIRSQAQIQSRELNLSESQAALDELEAVKYSAV